MADGKTRTVYLPVALNERVEAQRSADGRSFSNFVQRALESALGGAVSGDVRGVPASAVGSSPSPASSRASARKAPAVALAIPGVTTARQHMLERQAKLNVAKDRA